MEMVLEPDGSGHVDQSCGCFCGADAFQFAGLMFEPPRTRIAELKWDIWLEQGKERAHLELIRKVPGVTAPFKPHLRRAYESLVSGGVQRIELEAGLQGGPTYWARAGVDFAGGRPLLDHLEAVALDIGGPEFTSPHDVLVYPGNHATIRDAYLSSARLSSEMGEVLWVQPPTHLAYKVRLGIAIDELIPLGAAILHAIAPWNGVVDLTSPGSSDARFRAFLGLS
jgi:hypothetical protein